MQVGGDNDGGCTKLPERDLARGGVGGRDDAEWHLRRNGARGNQGEGGMISLSKVVVDSNSGSERLSSIYQFPCPYS